jgi:ribonuclease D
MPTITEQIVTKPEELPEVCAHLATARRFGFDTEFVGEDTYHPSLCLLQVATEDRLMLIDPLSVGPLDAFWRLVTDPANEVVVHAGREEVRLCHLWTGQTPANLFDLQIAAGLVGLTYPIGHGSLVGQLLGVSLTKTETLTEWRDRPLTAQQIRYAFDDVRYLLPLWRTLRGRLEALRRLDWAAAEFQRSMKIATEEEPTQEKWRKLKGIGTLSARQLAVIRELYRWRDETALQLNRPARIICRDDLLVEIARRNPKRERDLEVVRGLAHRFVPAILAAIERARNLPKEQWPAVAEREQDAPQVAMLTTLLSAVLSQLCGEMNLAANLVCATHDLRRLVRSAVDGQSLPESSILQNGWRGTHIRPALDAVLRGETKLRVAQLQNDWPLELLD